MAGSAKPNIENLGIEVIPTLIGGNLHKGTVENLIDGVSQITTASDLRAFWYGSTHYVEISTPFKCNIWRNGTSDTSHCGKLKIKQYQEDGVYTDVTDLYTIELKSMPVTEWAMFVKDLPAGRYRFEYGSAHRVDSEWYLESISYCMLKQDNKYYSINSSFYDTTMKAYTPIEVSSYENHKFTPDELFAEVTIGDETFRPIEKFSKFNLVTDDIRNDFAIKGLKYTRQLIVASDDISTLIAIKVNSLTLTSIKSSDADIKLAFSMDNGLTWKTWNESNQAFEDLADTTIPCKSYDTLSEEELVQWNTAMDNIATNGISIDVFNAIDFDLIDKGYMRFAYVLTRPTFDDVAETTQLSWQFDAMGSMRKMSDAEHYVDIYDHEIRVTTLIDNPLIKVNVII